MNKLATNQKKFLDNYVVGSWYYNPETKFVDVRGDFICTGKLIKDFVGIKFGRIYGHFVCSNNKLTSLYGAPIEVDCDFDCGMNYLSSLEGAPRSVGGHFNCNENRLLSLEGSPSFVGGRFFCFINRLTSLKGSPEKVGGDFVCSRNNLASLEGAPRTIGGIFVCYGNKLTSLVGAPEEIGSNFRCDQFEISEGGWNVDGWVRITNEGNQTARDLVLSIIDPIDINREIEKNPAKMAMSLKSVFKAEEFRELRSKLTWPKDYEEKANIAGDLASIGF